MLQTDSATRLPSRGCDVEMSAGAQGCGRKHMKEGLKRLTIGLLAQFALIFVAANSIVAVVLWPIAMSPATRVALTVVLATCVCSPLVWWRVLVVLRGSAAAAAAKFRSLLDAAPEGIIGVDEQGRIRFASTEAQRMFRYTEAELVGHSIEMLVPVRFADRHVQARAGFLSGPRKRPMGSGLEVVGLRSDGSEFPSDVSLSHVRTADGPLIISIVRDVSAQRETRNELIAANRKLQVSLDENLRRTEALRRLSEMGEVLQSCRSEQESHAVVARGVAGLLPGYTGAFYLYSQERDWIEAAADWGADAAALPRHFGRDDCWALRRGRLHVSTGTSGDVPCAHALVKPGRLNICAPMLAHGEAIGVLHLMTQQPTLGPVTADKLHLELLQAAADEVALSTANLRLRDALRQQSICDPLTELYNRRFMDEWLGRELPRSIRTHRPLALLIFDLDNFKRVNDTFGHECGDLVLREVGTYLRRAVRRSDIACRIGGEEFAMLLPETALADAAKIAEKLRAGIENLNIKYRDRPVGRVTSSIGVAEASVNGEIAARLLRAADAALYRAKAAGRNRVVTASDGDVEVPGATPSVVSRAASALRFPS
jgi:diguanylate cyclase (GGDEF)-like protein/PAS domain S-box-containing protein